MKQDVFQPYVSLAALKRTQFLPKPHDDWRLVAKPLVGQINGIDRIRGTTIATNGILVLIENEVGKAWLGHLDFFIPDEVEVDSDLYTVNNKPTKHEVMFAEFL